MEWTRVGDAGESGVSYRKGLTYIQAIKLLAEGWVFGTQVKLTVGTTASHISEFESHPHF